MHERDRSSMLLHAELAGITGRGSDGQINSEPKCRCFPLLQCIQQQVVDGAAGACDILMDVDARWPLSCSCCAQAQQN
jgi:hypothetical protein